MINVSDILSQKFQEIQSRVPVNLNFNQNLNVVQGDNPSFSDVLNNVSSTPSVKGRATATTAAAHNTLEELSLLKFWHKLMMPLKKSIH